MKRTTVAIFGGSFDPPHYAHLELACALRQEVDDIWIVPCGYREDKPWMSSYDSRLMMCRLAFNGLFVYEYEKDIPMVPTYKLMKEISESNPETKFVFPIGSDLLESLHSWNSAELLISEVNFLVFNRGGYRISELSRERYLGRENFKVARCNLNIEVSSTAVRKLAQKLVREEIGREEKIDRVDEVVKIRDVSEYIIDKGLYSNPS